MNFFDATINDARLDAAKFSIPVPQSLRRVATSRNGQKILVGIRPENILEATKQGRGDSARISGVVEMVEPIGHEAVVYARVGEVLLISPFETHSAPPVGNKVELVIELDALHLFDPATESRL